MIASLARVAEGVGIALDSLRANKVRAALKSGITFAGPGVFWQASKQLAISAAYNVQLAGKAKGQPGDLDITNFSQHLVKVKAAYSF